jgi:hypothetical protein
MGFLDIYPTVVPDYPLRIPRIATIGEALAICTQMWTDDKISNINRSLLQGMVDGERPWKESDLARNGQSYRCNVNWLTARAALNNARALFIDLLNSVPTLIDIEMDGDIDPTDAKEYSTVIAEEFTRTLRNWRQFQFQCDRLVDNFVGFGVGFAYHDSDRDWRWVSAGIGELLFPRSTRACEEYVEVVMMRRAYFLYELEEKIADEKIAKAKGWNPDAVRLAMEFHNKRDPRWGTDWEQRERELFESTYTFSYGSKSDMVWCDHLYVREIDGTYTHYILLTGGGDDFLYQREEEYLSCSDFLSIFTNGAGNGDIHGQRGLLFDIFPQTRAINEVQCSFVDNLRLSGALMLQATSEDAIQDMAMIDFGPFKILPAGVTISPTNLMAPTQDAVQALQYLSNQQASNTGQYSSFETNNQILQAATAFQARAATANDNSLSQSQTNIFYSSVTHLFRRVLRRLLKPDWQAGEPGGEEALEMQKRIFMRGVPPPKEGQIDVFGSIIDVQAVRAVGYGSPANRMGIMTQVAQLAGAMAPPAQNEFYRNSITGLLGNQRAADIYFPREPSAEEGLDQKIADFENQLMRVGQPQSVQGNNLVHATSHAAAIVQLIQEALAPQSQVTPQAVVTCLTQAIPHLQQHVQLLAQDHVNQQKAAQYGPILVQANAFLKKNQSIQQQNAAQSAQLGQDAATTQQAPDPLVQSKTAAEIQDIQSRIQERQVNSQVKMASAAAKIKAEQAAAAHKDATLAHKINVDTTREPAATSPLNGQ